METEAGRAIFESKVKPGSVVGEGEQVTNPQFADFMDALVHEGEDLFYRGEIAARVAEDCRAQGGSLTRADFEVFKLEHRRPLSLKYANADVYTNPPPSTGGLLIAFALSILKDLDLHGGTFGSSAHLSTMVQTMELTNEARIESRLHDASSRAAAAE